MKKCWLVLLLVLILAPANALAASFAADSAAATGTTGATGATGATGPTGPATDDPTDGESIGAALAIIGAIVVGAGVLFLVDRAHAMQKELARQVIAHGGTVLTTQVPCRRRHGTRACERHPCHWARRATRQLAWRVHRRGDGDQSGLGRDRHQGVRQGLETVRSHVRLHASGRGEGCQGHRQRGPDKGEHTVRILPPLGGDSYVFRVAIRNWGLIVVATVIVFGAIALGLTGHLDGGNFVALVAPLAALLGVSAVVGGSGGTQGGGASAGAGGAAGGTES